MPKHRLIKSVVKVIDSEEKDALVQCRFQGPGAVTPGGPADTDGVIAIIRAEWSDVEGGPYELVMEVASPLRKAQVIMVARQMLEESELMIEEAVHP